MTTFDYGQFNKKGLKDVVKWFGKNALPVAEVRGDNKPKRENGFQVKTAEIEFESGQVLVVKAKPDVPAFFQVKLNGKVVAIRDYKQLDSELREMAAYVKENEPKYAKNQEKAAAKQKIKVDLPKPVNTTLTEQTDALKASMADLQGQNEAVSNQITEVTAQVTLKSSQLSDLQSKLADEKKVTADLEAQLEKAQQGIFEAAKNKKPEETKDDPGEESTETADQEADEEDKKDVLESGMMQMDCPECGAEMESCMVELNASGDTGGGYRCPKCGAETDSEGVILEGCQKKDKKDDEGDGILEGATAEWKKLVSLMDGQTLDSMDGLSPVKNKMPGFLKNAITYLRRPYLSITKDLYEKLKAKGAEFYKYYGNIVAFGNTDGGFALMPIDPAGIASMGLVLEDSGDPTESSPMVEDATVPGRTPHRSEARQILESAQALEAVQILESSRSTETYQEAKSHKYPFSMKEASKMMVLRDFETGTSIAKDYEGPFFYVAGDSIMYTWMEDGERAISAKPRRDN